MTNRLESEGTDWDGGARVGPGTSVGVGGMRVAVGLGSGVNVGGTEVAVGLGWGVNVGGTEVAVGLGSGVGLEVAVAVGMICPAAAAARIDPPAIELSVISVG